MLQGMDVEANCRGLCKCMGKGGVTRGGRGAWGVTVLLGC